MLKKVTIILLALCALVMPMEAGIFDSLTGYFSKEAPPAPPMINVLIVHDKPGVVLEVKGKYKLFDPNTGAHISTRFIGKRKFIQAVHDGLKWGEEFPGIHQLMITPDEKTTTILVGGIEYYGTIYVYDIGGTISVINQLPIEEFLSATLALKYRDAIPEETLAGLVITARTSAYYSIENPKNIHWDIDVNTNEYQGVAAINTTSPVEQAIRATRFMIMSRLQSDKDKVVPFLARWNEDQNQGSGNWTTSQITLQQAIEMSKQGAHAAQILSKAFPGTKIELMHYAPEADASKK